MPNPFKNCWNVTSRRLQPRSEAPSGPSGPNNHRNAPVQRPGHRLEPIGHRIDPTTGRLILQPLGATALMTAARDGDLPTVQRLLAANCMVDQRDHAGRTALSYAAAEGHGDIVRLLLEHGAKVN